MGSRMWHHQGLFPRLQGHRMYLSCHVATSGNRASVRSTVRGDSNQQLRGTRLLRRPQNGRR
ncbi:hypothetical protein DPMN_054406 [Dreissena polymorpha]|uniref:Uncharacterized protein n=1 Tax=Dreissena polymorpha TaxID=45954 RepID=A0A9D4CN38_DREPO|nr:hypothetical protein DPMN_054406 [Dreissena polymorpha]